MLIGLCLMGVIGFAFLFLFNEYDKENTTANTRSSRRTPCASVRDC